MVKPGQVVLGYCAIGHLAISLNVHHHEEYIMGPQKLIRGKTIQDDTRRVARSSEPYLPGVRIAMKDDLVDRTCEGSLEEPHNLRKRLLVRLSRVGTALGGDDTLSCHVGGSRELSVAVHVIEECKRLAFWGVD